MAKSVRVPGSGDTGVQTDAHRPAQQFGTEPQIVGGGVFCDAAAIDYDVSAVGTQSTLAVDRLRQVLGEIPAVNGPGKVVKQDDPVILGSGRGQRFGGFVRALAADARRVGKPAGMHYGEGLA